MKLISTETKLGGQIIEEWKLMEDDEAMHISECDCCGLQQGWLHRLCRFWHGHACVPRLPQRQSGMGRRVMRAILLIATLALAGCGRCDWVAGGQHYDCEHPDDLAKVHAKWAEDDARRDAEYRADVTRWAIEENTQELQNLSAKLRHR